MIQAGERAPDFALTWKIPGDPVRLSDYRGRKVVLLFFPLAFSGVCTKEMCAVAEDWSDWTGLGAEVLGISVDSAWVNMRFADEVGARFPILSDFNKDTIDAYGVLNPDFFGMRGVSHRAAFVVDGEGVVRYAWMDTDADVMPPFHEIREAVAGLA